MKHLFVVAHPDDEVVGAGAFIYDAVRRGDEVAALIFNSCDTTRYTGNESQIVTDMHKSHEILGISKVYLGDIEDQNFHNADSRKMVQFIEAAIRDFQPDTIFTQHPGDVNTDHYWTAAPCIEAFYLWQRGRELVKPIEALYLMEVQSSTDWALNPSEARFQPNTYAPVSQEAAKAKIAALDAYENVIRPMPHPRSPEAFQAKMLLRGSQSGYDLAEAFECVFRRGV